MCEDKIIDLITEFSDKYLDDELKSLNIKLAHKLSENVSFTTDEPELWAAGIIYAIGQLNFLFDWEIKPVIDRDEIPYYFLVESRKVSLKARDIRRLLNLKLGDKEFSTRIVLSLNIPERDDDLKRVRLLSEVKSQMRSRYPIDVDFLRNREMERLIDKISKENNVEKYLDELCSLLRPVYFIQLTKKQVIDNDCGDFRLLFFTSMNKCNEVFNDSQDLKPELWAFFNIKYYMNNENFKGIIINYGSDDILLTKEMLRNVYPEPDKIDYLHMFFL